MSRLTAALAAVFVLAGFSAASASAATVTDRPLLFSFDGSDTTAGHLGLPSKIAIDNSTGAVYVSEERAESEKPSSNAVSKFNADGTAANFSATETSSLFGAPGKPFQNESLSVAVDNSGGATQGRIYVAARSSQRLLAFDPDGNFLWEISELEKRPSDVAVDPAGHPWLLYEDSVEEYASNGSPPAEISSFATEGFSDTGFDFDANDNFYTANAPVRKYVGGVFDSNLDPEFSWDVYADQSSATGQVFTIHGSTPDFNEYDSSGGLVGTFGRGAIDNGRGGAYNRSLDRLYVADQGLDVVDVFGPEATGVVPDPTIEATVASGPGTATFHGTINPQNVANGYYFEWATTAEGENFTQHVFRSPVQSLPEDNASHAVSYKATNLQGEPFSWKVRLVAINTASGLRQSVRGANFQTPKASANPVVSINAPTSIGSRSEHISGTIDPQEDSVTWRVETSTNPNCNEAFSTAATEYLPGGEIDTAVPVEYDLQELLPAQHYCVRISASSSFEPFGAGAVSEVKEFTTEAVPPSEALTAFAAPRTDTTARINGFVNPEGEADFTYDFEVSEDGSHWSALPSRDSSIDAREQIVVADELTDLTPNTTYYYRLAGAANDAGPGASTGDVKTFTTRSSAEMTLPQRGVELVNEPDKGNQNVIVPLEKGLRGMAADGEKALWTVTGGAPGGHNSAESTFLAERTETGWRSRALAPAAAFQVGGGQNTYIPKAATADYSHFIFDAEYKLFFGEASEATRIRLDDLQNQEVLQTYHWTEEHDGPGSLDMTTDAAHVLDVNHGTDQLEDIGNGSPEIVSIMPDGTPSSCGLLNGPSFVGGNTGGLGALAGGALEWRPGYHMVDTQDASLVYFEAKPNGECSKPWGLYLRDRDTEETKLVDPGAEGEDVAFITATPDARHGYFVTHSKLDSADTNKDADIYRWDVDDEEATCLTCLVADASVATSTPVFISSDFSHIYFESTKDLIPGEPSGATNLYLLSHGNLRFVAKNVRYDGMEPVLSNNGDVLLFEATPSRDLTADPMATSGRQLYLYEDPERSIECISCVRGGSTTAAVGSEQGFQMSPDGSTVAFVTASTLVPLDVNRGADVYEWRTGSRGLITDGVTEFPGSLAGPRAQGIDRDGSNILFSVTDPGLTGFEQDGLANLYDARIDGGFERPSPAAHCDGDSCQGPPQPPPAATDSASSAFSGRGNLRPKAKKRRRVCAKKRGRAKRRCVRGHKRQGHKSRVHRKTGRAK